MQRRFIPTAALGLAAVLAACGSSGGYGSSTAATTPGGSAGIVSVAQIAGVGTVLVSSTGQALYASDQEAGGMVLCTGACTSFWQPLAPGATAPMAASGITALGVIDRPDGTKQVTAAGRLLYTFSQDPPGKVTGNGFSDDFGGQHFTWHAVLADGTSAGSTGGGSSPTSSGSGYGY